MDSNKELKHTLEEAQRLHNTGDLVGALRAYRKAQKWVSDDTTKDEVQQYIDELHDMVAFVQESEGNQDKPWWEPLVDRFKENTVLIIGACITLTLIVLLAVLVPMVIRTLQKQSPVEPSPSPSEVVDRTERGDSYQVQAELKGNGGGGEGKIKKSTSVVTLTIPEVLYEPYPSKYVIQDKAPVYDTRENIGKFPISKVSLNTLVLLVNKTADNQWLQIETAGEHRYWISAKALADSRYKSPAEIDAEIKAALGGKYWEIQVEGNAAPFQYYLYVNAPTAVLAYQSTLDAYQSYGDRQMLKAMNAISHQKIEALRLEEASQAPAPQSTTVNIQLRVYARDARGEDSLLGEKQFSLQRGKDKRYEAKRLLEGF
jgi:hypothetical protein